LILLELQNSLDHDRGGDLSARLHSLYDYLRERLTAANLEQREEPLTEVERLLMTLLEGWRAWPPRTRTGWGPALPGYAPALEPEPAMAGRSWVY